MIYLDNAATSFHKPQCVIDAVVQAMQHLGNAGRGAHDEALAASRLIFDARQKLADFFGAGDPSGVAFTMNSTESLNIAIQGLLCPGDHVITTQMEHNSVLRPLYLMERKGVKLSIIPADRLGRIDLSELETQIRPETKAVVCTHASNLTGNMIDIAQVGEICRRHGVLLVVDASQSAGVYPIHMMEMGIDVLCFTGHKSLLGPQGTGGICVREGVKILPLLAGGSGVHSYSKEHPDVMPTALEAGTLNGHGIAGLSAAVSYIEETGLDQLRNREMELMWKFYNGVKDCSNVKIYGDFSVSKRCPIVALNIGDYDSGQVADELFEEYGICTRAGAHCAPLMHQALGTVDQGAVRFSFSHQNTEAEVDAAIEAVNELAKD
ncbi:cysteine desulfurase [Clostridium sp. chh4-2]|uniref:aminotransferase class V-fold PLP-dependent enzyme n=1 Tax=Clostridium sp. chh4-2 TaxID=2067550 RepID=UPI000CCE326C|nr:aminotransferase class V-fold PLP-dependent enzyme [Clostridium sp. chh4-2]PNV63528.1 cysteine desulfurase [Clostridium sp. chh4-2]